MNCRRITASLFLGLAVAGCTSVETATREAPLEAPAISPEQVSFDVKEIRVSVPKTLKVSEANRYYPGGDIVWREDPIGDRHAQVKAIVEAGLQEGVDNMGAGQVPVILDVQVTRFHALTEKARYTTGGVHAIQFHMLLRDAKTGQPIGEPEHVKADFRGLGGRKAIDAENRGITQKYRITKQLAYVIQKELTSDEGYVAQDLGLFGALNQL
ncbi:MAG: DUF6778 family protein [Pseudomonadota bacterium]